MKFLFLISVLLVLSGCLSQTSTDKIENDTAQPKPTVNNAEISNKNQWTAPPKETVDNAKLGKLEKQNAEFRKQYISALERNLMNYISETSISE